MKELIGKTIITFPVGPIVSNSDGLTPVTDLTLSGADEKAIRKYGNVTPVSISANSWAAISSMEGHYNLTLTNSQMDTYGPMRISIQDDSKCLPYFEDVSVVTSAFWNSKYNTNDWASAHAVSSLDTRVSSIGVEVDSIQAQVTSTYNKLSDFPVSGYLPSSETLNAHIATLATSETLNAHIITLPTSETVMDAISSVGVRVSSIAIEVDSIQAQVTSNYHRMGDFPTSGYLPSSETLNAHIATLATSETLNAHIITLPTSETLNAHIVTLPTSEAVGTIADKALSDVNLDHLMKTVVTDSGDLTNEVADFSVLGLMMAAGGDMSSFVSSDDSLQAIAEGAAGGGASASEVQSACFDVIQDMNLDHLMKTVVADSSDLTTEVADFSVLSLIMASGGDTSTFVSSDDSLQGISEGAAGGGANKSEVQSACFDAFTGILPNSETLKSHIDTLPTSQTLNAHIVTLPTSETLKTHIDTLPTSEGLHSEIGTLPNSQTLNAHIVTLPTSSMVHLADDRVSSVEAQVDSTYNRLGDFPVSGYLPSSETLNTHVITLPTSETLETQINTLPTSETLNDHIATLPTSETLYDHIATLPVSGYLPSSSTLDDLIATLPTSLTLQAHIATLPTSETLNAHMVTLPNSQTVMNAVSSMDVRVTSLAVHVGSLATEIFATEVESGYSLLRKQRIDMSVLTGITSGGGTSTLHFRDVGDSKARLIVTVDSDGNRTAVNTLDGS